MQNEGGSIKRTIARTKCKCTRVGKRNKNAKKDSTIEFTKVIFGAYRDTTRATRHLRRLLHDSTVNVISTEVETEFRTMPIKTFIKYSRKTKKEV